MMKLLSLISMTNKLTKERISMNRKTIGILLIIQTIALSLLFIALDSKPSNTNAALASTIEEVSTETSMPEKVVIIK